MKTLQIDETQAKELYNKAIPELKQMLEEIFGDDFFNVIEKVKTFAEALEVTGRPEVPKFFDVPEDLRKFFEATYKVVVINEALNDGIRFKLYDLNVNRYYPWFATNGSSSGFAFRGSHYDDAIAFTGGGSRFCLKDEETAKYAGTQFKNEYREMLES